MKSKNTANIVFLLVVAICVAAASVASASPWHNWRGSGGWSVNSPYQKKYETANVKIVSGKVVGIERSVPLKGMGSGIILLMKTDKEIVQVHLGPAWYIERLDYRISVGDKLEVKGSKIDFNGKPAVIAAEIKKNDDILVLRDKWGIPVWAGWGWKR